MIIMYGIPNCDTIKKAKTWLIDHNIDFTFHNYKKDGVSHDYLNQLISKVPLDVIINKRGTTYKKLSDEQKIKLDTGTDLSILVAYPSIIKRPIILVDDIYNVGFSDTSYREIFL